jgi:nucleoside-diphosphate-sugar epimerase
VVELLLAREAVVESWDVVPPPKAEHAPVWRMVDVMDTDEVHQALSAFAPTHVIHLAARTDLRGTTVEDYEVNIAGTANLLASADASPTVERVLVASTRLVCRLGYEPAADDDYAPDTPYGASKAKMEDLVRGAGLSKTWTIVRPTSIWGPWFGTPYRDFFLAVASGRYLHPKGVSIPKSFGFVGNTAHQLYGLCRAASDLVDKRTFYAADYEPIDVLDFATQIQRALMRRRVRSVPVGVLRIGALLGDGLLRCGMREPPLTRFRLKNLLTPMVYDLSPLREVVGPVPYSVGSGIDLSLEWLRERRLV